MASKVNAGPGGGFPSLVPRTAMQNRRQKKRQLDFKKILGERALPHTIQRQGKGQVELPWWFGGELRDPSMSGVMPMPKSGWSRPTFLSQIPTPHSEMRAKPSQVKPHLSTHIRTIRRNFARHDDSLTSSSDRSATRFILPFDLHSLVSSAVTHSFKEVDTNSARASVYLQKY